MAGGISTSVPIEEQCKGMRADDDVAPLIAKRRRVEQPICGDENADEASQRNCIPRRCFERCVRSALDECGVSRIQRDALAILHTAAEAKLVELLSEAHVCAQHAGRKTINERDFKLALRMVGH